MKRTPLYDEHVRLGGKMVEFAGWEMPVQYSGVIQEHQNVRERVGLFDVSHMGEIWVSGPNAEAALQQAGCKTESAARPRPRNRGRDSCRLTEIVGKLWAQRGQHIASWRAVPVIGMILIVLSELSDVVRFGGSTNRRAVVRQRVSLGILRLSAV